MATGMRMLATRAITYATAETPDQMFPEAPPPVATPTAKPAIAGVAANANHLNCWRSTPDDRRYRWTTDARMRTSSGTPMTWNTELSAVSSAWIWSLASSGLPTPTGTLPGENGVNAPSATPVAIEAQPMIATARQRRLGNRPDG